MKNGNTDNGVVMAYLIMALCVAVVSLIGVGYGQLVRRDMGVAATGDMMIKAPDGFYVTEVLLPMSARAPTAWRGLCCTTLPLNQRRNR